MTGRILSKLEVEGVDFVDPQGGRISMKGPLGIDSRTGMTFPIEQEMIDGLERAVIKDVQRNSATNWVVVDTRGLSETQRNTLIENIKSAVGDSPRKQIFFVY